MKHETSKLKLSDSDVIMLIDDDQTDLFINFKVFTHSKINNEIISFTSTHKGLDYLQTCNIESLPKYIFLDINLPNLNGYGFLSHFSDLPPEILEFCKIIILTSSDDPKDVLLMKCNPNVVAYLNKPLNLNGLQHLFEI